MGLYIARDGMLVATDEVEIVVDTPRGQFILTITASSIGTIRVASDEPIMATQLDSQTIGICKQEAK